jgi:mannose-1-phosphate guanylyltransferase
MDVMLLAAGRSARLGPLGREVPKPLVPICGYPAIRFGIAACARAGLERVVINVFHHGESIQQTLGDGRPLGVKIQYSVEQDLLGTGGGIAQARTWLAPGPVLVMNAKVVADIDLTTLLAAHADSGAQATLVLRDDPDPRRWGAISVDSESRVVGILNARSPHPPVGPVIERMFTGIHVLEPALMDRLAPRPCDLIRDAYIPALEAGARMMALRLDGYFAEHSTPDRYLAGNLALLRDPSLLPHPPGPLTGTDLTAVIDPSARVEGPCRIEGGATIEAGAVVGPEVVLGRGARVVSGVRVQRSVVWPGATVSADAHRTIFTAAGAVSPEQP